MKLPVHLAVFAAVSLLLSSKAVADSATQPASALSAAAKSAGGTEEIITPSGPLPPGSKIDSSGGGAQLAIYLCLLIALIGGGSYFLKNGFGFSRSKSKGMRKLNVAETRMLGNRQFLVVAEYEGRKLLLGVCPGRIELISELAGKADEAFVAHLSESQ